MTSARRVFVLLYTTSGAAALVYEVTWTRLLTLQMGHTVAAASTVLAAFMGGLAMGAWSAGHYAPRVSRRAGLRGYAALEAVVAIAAAALPFPPSPCPPPLARAYNDGFATVRFGACRLAPSLVLLG